MADNLVINKQYMETAIANYEAKRVELENICLKISNEVRVLDGSWHGEASERYKSQFEEMYNKLKQSDATMGNIVTKLKKSLETYTEVEGQIVVAFDNINEGKAYL